MKLTATVVGLEHGSKYTDGKPRLAIRIEEADSMWKEIRLPVDGIEDYKLGEPFVVTLLSPTYETR